MKEGKEPIILDKRKKLQIERKEKLKNLVKADIDFVIENIDILSKDELKEYLINLKNKLK